MCGVTIRSFTETDAVAAANVFFRAVRFGTVNDYNDDQRRAWAPSVPDTEFWKNRLAQQTCYVAERSGTTCGFMTINQTGYIDLAFVAPEIKGRGVGTSLYVAIETWARQHSISLLTTEASLTARPFFERHGWTVIQQQTIVRHGVELTNFKMEKRLPAGAA